MLDKYQFGKLYADIEDVLDAHSTEGNQKTAQSIVDILFAKKPDPVDRLSEEEKAEIDRNFIRAIRRSGKPFKFILAGSTNSGKTSVATHLFANMPLYDPEGNALNTDDQPDVTKRIEKIPFGDGKQIVYDTPGLMGDTECSRNKAAAALGLALTDHRCEDCETIELVTLTAPQRDGTVSVHSREEIRIDDSERLDNELDRKNLGCLYVFDSSATPFYETTQMEYIAALREIYGEKLLIVSTKNDLVDGWRSPDAKRRRYENIDRYIGDHMKINGLTGAGKEAAAYTIMSMFGWEKTDFMDAFRAELACAQLYTAASQVSPVFAAVLFNGISSCTKHVEADAVKLFHNFLDVIGGVLDAVFYEISDEEFRALAVDPKNFIAKKMWFRAKTGFRARWKFAFSNVVEKEPAGPRYVLKADPQMFAEVYYQFYSQFFDREIKYNTHGLLEEGNKVPESKSQQWFLKQFEKHAECFEIQNLLDLYQDVAVNPMSMDEIVSKVFAQSRDVREKAWEFYKEVGHDVFVRFWEEHHPELMTTEMPSEEDSS